MNVFCEGGWLAMYQAMIDAGVVTRIRLFQNDYVPAFTDTEADYTEADFSGYFGFIVLAWRSVRERIEPRRDRRGASCLESRRGPNRQPGLRCLRDGRRRRPGVCRAPSTRRFLCPQFQTSSITNPVQPSSISDACFCLSYFNRRPTIAGRRRPPRRICPSSAR